VNLAVVEGFEIVRVEGDPERSFQAGSVSKPVAALTTLRLVEKGDLALDEEVNERLVS
jgi:CubicO group peptidase (beta-lactamase class C family)